MKPSKQHPTGSSDSNRRGTEPKSTALPPKSSVSSHPKRNWILRVLDAAAAYAAGSTRMQISVTQPEPKLDRERMKLDRELLSTTKHMTRWTAAAALFAGLAGIGGTLVGVAGVQVAIDTKREATSAASATREIELSIAREQTEQRRKRYADLVVISSYRDNDGDEVEEDEDRDRQLTVRNLGALRITKPRLRISGTNAVIPLKNVEGCSNARFLIDNAWYELGAQGNRIELVFQDADGGWWSRRESVVIEEVKPTSPEVQWGDGIPVGQDAKPLKTLGVRNIDAAHPVDSKKIAVDRATFAKSKYYPKKRSGERRAVNRAVFSYSWYALSPNRTEPVEGGCPN